MEIILVLSLLFFAIGLLLYRHQNNKTSSSLLLSVFVFLYMSLVSIYLVSDYFTDEGVNDAVIFHVIYGLDGAGFAEYHLIIIVAVALFVVSILVAYLYYRMAKNRTYPKKNNINQVVSMILVVSAFIINPATSGLWTSTSKQVVNRYLSPADVEFTDDDKDFLKHYIKGGIKERSENHPNFIYIYAESLEQTYFDEDIFPGLIANLKEIKQESFEFTNIHQISGSGWTVAGMASSQCGVPLYAPSEGNSMGGLSSFYSGARCLGDLLNDGGYYLSFMQGSSIGFAGIGKLFSSHNFDEVKGRDDLVKQLKDQAYVNGWGLYDDSLFSLAYERYKKLSATRDRFGLVIVTLDTHHPNGHQSNSCKEVVYKDGSNPILNAVKCSDHLIGNFIKRVKESEFGNNTVIVVSSDHLAMRNSATGYLKKGRRRNLFFIIDPRRKEHTVTDKRGAMLDVGSTVANILGFDNTIGLGRDLLGDEKTLSEAFNNVNSIIESWEPSIRKLWKFPKLADKIIVSPEDKTVSISNQEFSYPVLIEVHDNKYITPYFEFYSPLKSKTTSEKKLEDYLIDLEPSAPFIWVDQCLKINYLAVGGDEEYCAVVGKMSGKIRAIAIDEALEIPGSDLYALFESSNDEILSKKRKLDLVSISIGMSLDEVYQETPKQSKIFVGDNRHKSLLLDYYKTVGLVPISDTEDIDEFYFLESDLDVDKLSERFYLEAIVLESWRHSVSNYFRVNFWDEPPKAMYMKAVKKKNN